MDQLTTIREHIETMMSNGGLPEGDYLSIMNALKGVYDAIPKPPAPTSNVIDIRSFFGGSRTPDPPSVRELYHLYFNVSYNGWEDHTPGVPFIHALDALIKHPTNEGVRRQFNSILDSTHNWIPFLLQRHSHLWRGMPLWRDPAHQDLVSTQPAWRRAVLKMMVSQRLDVISLLSELWDGTKESPLGKKPSDDLVRDLALRIELPGICFAQKLHYRKLVNVDTTKLHRISITIPTCTRPRIIDCWTNRIQFGRTPCVHIFNQFGFVLSLWAYLHYYGGGTVAVEEDFHYGLVKYYKNLYNRDPFYLETSGITARTKNKHRKYISHSLSDFSITYAESINAPH